MPWEEAWPEWELCCLPCSCATLRRRGSSFQPDGSPTKRAALAFLSGSSGCVHSWSQSCELRCRKNSIGGTWFCKSPRKVVPSAVWSYNGALLLAEREHFSLESNCLEDCKELKYGSWCITWILVLRGEERLQCSVSSKYINTSACLLFGFQNEDKPTRNAGKQNQTWGGDTYFMCSSLAVFCLPVLSVSTSHSGMRRGS